jgi:biotin carboxyl carrier protein
MTRAENESLERWRREKDENQVDGSAVEKLLEDPRVVAVEAPVDANVWKVEVAEGDEVGDGSTVSFFPYLPTYLAGRRLAWLTCDRLSFSRR